MRRGFLWLGLVLVGTVLLVQPVSAQVVKPSEQNIVTCTAVASTATILTAFGGQCAAPGAGVSLYITDISAGGSVASGTTADSAATIKYGTGGTCGTGTTVVWSAPTPANTTVSNHLMTPIRIPANNELCWIFSPAGTKWFNVLGYKAP